MTNRSRRLLRSALGGLGVTLLAALGAGYLSVVDRGSDAIRTAAIVVSLGLEPFWWTCGVFAWRIGGPKAWLLVGAALVNVAVWGLVFQAAGAVVRRMRLR